MKKIYGELQGINGSCGAPFRIGICDKRGNIELYVKNQSYLLSTYDRDQLVKLILCNFEMVSEPQVKFKVSDY